MISTAVYPNKLSLGSIFVSRKQDLKIIPTDTLILMIQVRVDGTEL